MRARKQTKKITWFSKTIIFFNFAAVILLLLSYLSSVVNPSSLWALAFLGLAYPVLLLVNFCFVIYWLLKKPSYALASLIAILIGWKFLVSTIGFRESTAIQVAKSSKNVIRIMTWNVHYFRKFDQTNDKATKDQMLEIIRKEQPDVLCLQEFFTRKKGDYNFKKPLLEILNSEHYYIESTLSNDYEMWGMAIFSKLPIRNKGIIPSPSAGSGNEIIFADLGTGKKMFRIYNVHLQSIKFRPEDYEFLKKVKEIDTDVGGTRRVAKMLKQAFVKRGEQADYLKKHLDSVTIPYVITGDFNDTPISYAVNTISANMNNGFREKGSGFGVTYNGDFPNFQIDYIFSSPDFEVRNYIIIDKKISDHYPVRTDLELK